MNKEDADIWGEIIEWGKNEGSKSERRDSGRKDEISGWNRKTDRGEETEGGDRLMERGSKAG